MIISKQIEQRIKTIPKGTLLLIDDFIEEYDYETARKVLQRLTNDGQLMRLNRVFTIYQKKTIFWVLLNQLLSK